MCKSYITKVKDDSDSIISCRVKAESFLIHRYCLRKERLREVYLSKLSIKGRIIVGTTSFQALMKIV